MTEELITPQHLSVLQSISLFISDHLQCLFSLPDISAVGLNGFGIMDFFMHPFVKSDTLLVYTIAIKVSLSHSIANPSPAFLTHSSQESRFLLYFPVQFFSFDLKVSSYQGPKDLDFPLFNVSHDHFLNKTVPFSDSFDFSVLVELNY